jgi:hypothetical protein
MKFVVVVGLASSAAAGPQPLSGQRSCRAESIAPMPDPSQVPTSDRVHGDTVVMVGDSTMRYLHLALLFELNVAPLHQLTSPLMACNARCFWNEKTWCDWTEFYEHTNTGTCDCYRERPDRLFFNCPRSPLTPQQAVRSYKGMKEAVKHDQGARNNPLHIEHRYTLLDHGDQLVYLGLKGPLCPVSGSWRPGDSESLRQPGGDLNLTATRHPRFTLYFERWVSEVVAQLKPTLLIVNVGAHLERDKEHTTVYRAVSKAFRSITPHVVWLESIGAPGHTPKHEVAAVRGIFDEANIFPTRNLTSKWTTSDYWDRRVHLDGPGNFALARALLSFVQEHGMLSRQHPRALSPQESVKLKVKT